MKIAPPKLSSQLAQADLTEMIDDAELESAQLVDIDAVNCNIPALDLNDALLEKMQFTGSHFSRITMRDVVAKQTDFSSASLDSGSIVRVQFTNCRMMGVDFNRTSLHDVVFRSCKLDLANFRQADLRRVQFIDCTLVETDFGGSTLTSIEFQSSILEATVFSQAKCKLVDLRTSQLLNLSGWGSLKGASIDGLQLVQVAPYLAQELGISVRD